MRYLIFIIINLSFLQVYNLKSQLININNIVIKPHIDTTSPTGIYIPGTLMESFHELDNMLSPEFKDAIKKNTTSRIQDSTFQIIKPWLKKYWEYKYSYFNIKQRTTHMLNNGLYEYVDFLSQFKSLFVNYQNYLNKKPVYYFYTKYKGHNEDCARFRHYLTDNIYINKFGMYYNLDKIVLKPDSLHIMLDTIIYEINNIKVNSEFFSDYYHCKEIMLDDIMKIKKNAAGPDMVELSYQPLSFDLTAKDSLLYTIFGNSFGDTTGIDPEFVYRVAYYLYVHSDILEDCLNVIMESDEETAIEYIKKQKYIAFYRVRKAKVEWVYRGESGGPFLE